ncbi:MAG: LacI family DNA-binding transcriptional regulator [Gemmiger sp.]|nr:LacI family DNA-binding transcriptional regulator [Gemmiger sp.]
MTIYDIAREAGVSASSVSRVVNHKPGVKPATRAKIEALMEKYNFSLNETARGLSTQASKMIGILVTDIRTIHYTDTAYCVAQELAARGYCSILFNTGASDESQCHYLQILEQRSVEGVVLIGSSFQTPAVQAAIARHLPNIPVVLVNGYLDLPNVYGVLSDDVGGLASCVALLARKGRTRLAYVRDAKTPSGQLKLQGYLQGMAACGRAGDGWVYEATTDLQAGYEATQQILREHPDVQGILYSVDLIAAGGVRALTDSGKAVPGDVAVIGVDNCLYGELCNPRLTSLDNNLLQSSATGAMLLIDRLENRDAPHQVLLPYSIVERETT